MEMKQCCATGAGTMGVATGRARLLGLTEVQGVESCLRLCEEQVPKKETLSVVFSKHLILSCSRSWESLASSSGKAFCKSQATRLIPSLGLEKRKENH